MLFSNRMVAEDEVEEEEVNLIYPAKGTQTFGKKTEAIEEPSEEGGASTPNKVGKPCHLLATIVERLAITKRSAEKEEASWLQQGDNSQTTPPTRNTPIMADSS